MIIKALHWSTVVGALCSAGGFVLANLPWLASIEVVCAVGLVIGLFFTESVRVTRVSQMLLVLQTIILGAVWPSAVTIAALLVLPGLIVVVLDAIGKPLRPGWRLYFYGAAALAAWSLAAEGWLLATVERG